ncbi:MAG: hypothetical protein ACXWP5_01375, partial [Bdellovibrionota bacterium]
LRLKQEETELQLDEAKDLVSDPHYELAKARLAGIDPPLDSCAAARLSSSGEDARIDADIHCPLLQPETPPSCLIPSCDAALACFQANDCYRFTDPVAQRGCETADDRRHAECIIAHQVSCETVAKAACDQVSHAFHAKEEQARRDRETCLTKAHADFQTRLQKRLSEFPTKGLELCRGASARLQSGAIESLKQKDPFRIDPEGKTALKDALAVQDFYLNSIGNESDCVQKTGGETSLCKKLGRHDERLFDPLRSLYTPEKVQMVRDFTKRIKDAYRQITAEKLEEKKISPDEATLILSRIDRTDFEVPTSLKDARKLIENAGHSECLPESAQAKGECPRHAILLGAQYMALVSKPGGMDHLAGILAHEIGHAVSMNYDGVDPQFDHLADCLGRRQNYARFSTEVQPTLRAEGVADYLGTKALAKFLTREARNASASEKLFQTTLEWSCDSSDQACSDPHNSDPAAQYPAFNSLKSECQNLDHPMFRDRVSQQIADPDIKKALGCDFKNQHVRNSSAGACEL